MFPSRRLLPLLVVGGVGLAACSSGQSALEVGGDDPAPTTAVAATTPDGGTTADTGSDTTAMPTTTVAPLADLAACPTEALDSAEGPIEVVFWHAMANDLETPLIALTDEYNASQDKVRVVLQNQTGYESLLDKYINAGQGSRPTLVQFPEYTLRSISDSGTTVPAEACLESSGYDTSTFVPRTLTAYQYEGIQRGMPFNVSNPVLYYNRKMFEAAGLDPDSPPVSLDELRAASEQIVSSGAAPVALVLDSGPDSGGGWFLEQWFGRAG